GRDLTGYEDGTENPEDDDAVVAAIAAGQGTGLDGGSFWALQQWQHDYAVFDRMPAHEQDHAVGRRRSDNEELDDAPESAHVKRTAQESFEPEAFLLRRSMPWWSVSPRGADHSGLMFSAFGCSFDAFEAQIRSMLGMDDGISDALFRFSRPLTGCYFWCPPVAQGKLDLSALGM
ncbi:MAG: Dyp-type peroxidase, partial [Comamonas sp.]